MNEKRLKRYISNLATAQTFLYYVNPKYTFDINKVRRYFIQGLRNYCKLRLDLMSKPEVIQVERALATAAVKTGIIYAVQHYNINLGNYTVDEIVDSMMPGILEDVHSLKYDAFSIVLRYCDK